MLVEKEVIRPGVYWYVDPDTGLPRTLEATPDKIDYWLGTGKEMLAAGLSVPVPLEHDAAAFPRTAAQKAADRLRNNAGEVKDYKLYDGHVLKAVVDVQDPDVGKKLGHSIKWTSPWFNSFTDGNGRKWDGVISHLALTTRPRIVKQEPFSPQAVAASLSILPATFDAAKVGKGLSLSRAGLLKKGDDGKLAPAYPMAFSLYSGAALASAVEPPKKKELPEKDPKATAKPDATPPVADPALPAEEPSLVDPDGDIPVHEVIKDLLEVLDITMDEDTTQENFCEKLYSALMPKMKMLKGKDMADQTPNPQKPADPTLKPPVVEEQPPLYMSLEQARAIPDPQVRQMALSLLDQRDRYGRLEKNLLDQAAAARKARVAALLKRYPKTQRDVLTAKLAAMEGGMKFALGADGVVKDDMAGVLDALEAAVIDLPAMLATQEGRSPTELPHPEEPTPGRMTPERAKSVAAEMRANAGIRDEEPAAAGANGTGK